MKCFFCGGAAHPATGHAYSATVIACRNCFMEFFMWAKARINHNPLALAAQGIYVEIRKKRKK